MQQLETIIKALYPIEFGRCVVCHSFRERNKLLMSLKMYGKRKGRLAHVGNDVMVHSCLTTTGKGKIFSLVPSPSCRGTIIKSISPSVRLFDIGLQAKGAGQKCPYFGK